MKTIKQIFDSIIAWLTIKKSCAWCESYLGGNPLIVKNVSHGACPICASKVLAEYRATRKH